MKYVYCVGVFFRQMIQLQNNKKARKTTTTNNGKAFEFIPTPRSLTYAIKCTTQLLCIFCLLIVTTRSAKMKTLLLLSEPTVIVTFLMRIVE